MYQLKNFCVNLDDKSILSETRHIRHSRLQQSHWTYAGRHTESKNRRRREILSLIQSHESYVSPKIKMLTKTSKKLMVCKHITRGM